VYRRSRQAEAVQTQGFEILPSTHDGLRSVWTPRSGCSTRIAHPVQSCSPQIYVHWAISERDVDPGPDANQRRLITICACLDVVGWDWFDQMFPGCTEAFSD
jgi:hypothetical protein